MARAFYFKQAMRARYQTPPARVASAGHHHTTHSPPYSPPYLLSAVSLRDRNFPAAMLGLLRWRGGGGGGGSRGYAARGALGAAATVAGLRVSRAATLRVSALFALRALLSGLPLPLPPDLLAGAWLAGLAAAQTSAWAASAAEASWLPAPVAAAVGRVFSPADAPFVAGYAAVVLVLGPLVAVAEAGVVVFEAVRVTRAVEHRMSSPDPATVARWQRVNLAAAAAVAAGAGAFAATKPLRDVAPAAGAGFAALLAVALATAAGNILHAALLGAYVVFLAAAAAAEAADVVPGYGVGARAVLGGSEARAALFAVSVALELAVLVRGPAIVGAVVYSADAVRADPSLVAAPEGFAKALVSAVAVVAVTFRFMVYHHVLRPGEYQPFLCRGVQALFVIGLYTVCMWIEGKEDEEGEERY